MESFTFSHWAFVVLVPITLLVLLAKAGALLFRRLCSRSVASNATPLASEKCERKGNSIGSWLVLSLYAATLYACAGVFASARSHELSQFFGAAASITVLYGVVKVFQKP